MAIWASIFALAVFATISKFSVFAPSTFGSYGSSTFIGDARSPIALRADLPYVGWFIVASAVLLVAAIASFFAHISKGDDRSSRIGFGLLGASLLTQIGGIAMLVYQVKAIKSVLSYIDPQQYERFAVWMLQQQDVPQAQIAAIPKAQLIQMSSGWVAENADKLRLSLNANPVELSALITGFIGVFFVFLFSIKTERIREALPSAETLDGLMYKLGGITFAGLALLLITGAIWANESWGRYWGWDAKETGALVAWFTYAGFLHSRIAYGWRGRSSAYFALVAFLFVVFTYLGVSYLLPGLHSYA
jgi:cytochrome c-type biogenesis protein CcsB